MIFIFGFVFFWRPLTFNIIIFIPNHEALGLIIGFPFTQGVMSFLFLQYVASLPWLPVFRIGRRREADADVRQKEIKTKTRKESLDWLHIFLAFFVKHGH